jgi:gliding motility-associated protein GldC
MSDKENKVVKTSDITCRVGLDTNNVPVKIEWKAQDSPDTPSYKESKAMLLSLFDSEFRDTYKIDLWTNELQIGEMNKFMYQTLKGLADTYFRATNNKEMANDMRKFVQYFGEQTEVVPKEEG